MGASLTTVFFAYYLKALLDHADHLLRILFAYLLKSDSLHTAWGFPSDHILRILYGDLQVSFFAYYI